MRERTMGNIKEHGLYDMHVHLYGCLTAEMLWKLARRKENIDWNWFESEFEKAFDQNLDMNEIVSTQENFLEFCSIFYCQETVLFPQFQAKFNLIITLCDITDLEEVKMIVRWICDDQHKQGIRHAEYRMLLPTWVKQNQFNQIIETICTQLLMYEQQTQGEFQGRFSLSLPRRNEYGDIHYEWLQTLMKHHPIVSQMTTSVDFCFFEEGFPPKDKRTLFHKIRSHNQQFPQKALAILYHVGESFTDKSLESAIRWIHESAFWGAHRLGHAIALGIEPNEYLGKEAQETVEERLDQIEYDLHWLELLNKEGVPLSRKSLLEEKEQLLRLPTTEILSTVYHRQRIEEIRKRQEFVMRQLKELDVCIESCPTSNLRIGMISNPLHHPIYRFLKTGVPLVIGSDDPGIFDTTLSDEFQWIARTKRLEIGWEENIKNNTYRYRSESLVNRSKEK